MEDIEANENETPFSIHFHARMPKTTKKNCVDRSANLEAAVAPANVLIVNPYQKALNFLKSVHLYITQGRNYDQFILMCHVHSAHETDLGRDTVLFEELWAIKRCCICFRCPFMFRITI